MNHFRTLLPLMILFIGLTTQTASAQFLVKDPFNLAQNIKQLAELKNQVTNSAENLAIVKAAQKAHRRAKEEYDVAMNEWYRTKSSIEQKYGVDLDVAITHVRGDGSLRDVVDLRGNTRIFSYHMSGSQFSAAFPMDRAVGDTEKHNQQNREKLMTNIATHMQMMRRHENEIRVATTLIDALSTRMEGANDSLRSALQAEVSLLSTRRESLYGLLEISRANMDAGLDAQRIYEDQQVLLQHEALTKALNASRTPRAKKSVVDIMPQ